MPVIFIKSCFTYLYNAGFMDNQLDEHFSQNNSFVT